MKCVLEVFNKDPLDDETLSFVVSDWCRFVAFIPNLVVNIGGYFSLQVVLPGKSRRKNWKQLRSRTNPRRSKIRGLVQL